MSTEPYVPTMEVVRDAVTFPRERLGEPRPVSGEAFDRFVAKIKADAVREAHVHIGENLISGGNVFAAMLDYADRIEEEA